MSSAARTAAIALVAAAVGAPSPPLASSPGVLKDHPFPSQAKAVTSPFQSQ